MKLTRRKLTAAMLGSAAGALAQTQPPQPATPEEELTAARERMRTNAAALAAQELPMAVEPAFSFKA